MASQRDEESLRRTAGDSGTALVVEGNGDEASVLAAWLRRHSERVVTAQSGSEAVSVARRILPDWIFVDEALPDMSPVELAHRVRSSTELEAARVVALVDDPYRAATGIFDRILGRPLHGEQLARLIGSAGCDGPPG